MAATMHELPKASATYEVSDAVDKEDVQKIEPDAEQSISEEEVPIPLRLKVPALLCVLFFTLGSNWAESILGPLKSTIRKDLDVSNAKWGVIASASNLVNSVMPIFAGLAVDYYGPNTISIISSVSNLAGAGIAAVGASIGSFPTLIAGQIIGGFGNMAIETAQSKLYTRWFAGSRHLAFVYGLDIAIGRVIKYGFAGVAVPVTDDLADEGVSVTANATSVPIMEAAGSWSRTFWVAAIMCAVTLAVNIIYCLLAKRIPRPSPSARPTREDAMSSNLSGGKSLAGWLWLPLGSISVAFWLLLITQILQGGAVGTYMNLAPDVISRTRGSTKAIAGYTSAVGQIVPIFLTPTLGLIIDRFGRRMHYVTATGVIYVLVLVLLQFTQVHPLFPLITSSVALSMNALPFLVSIPLLVPDQKLFGTAFGLWYAFQQAGQVITDVSAGAIQDRTPGGGYRWAFLFLIVIKALDIAFGLSYMAMDKWKLAGVLKLSSVRRLEAEAIDAGAFDTPLKHAQPWYTRVGLVVLSAIIVAAWTVYLVYAN